MNCNSNTGNTALKHILTKHDDDSSEIVGDIRF